VPPRVFRGDLVRTLAIGLPLATLLMAVVLGAQHLPPTGVPFLVIVATLGIFAFNTLCLA